MKRLVMAVAGVASVGLVGGAEAADLAAKVYAKAPPQAAAIYDWSGFYLGLNGGGGSSRKCWTNTSTLGTPTVPAFNEGCHDATGGLAGGQIGYRWQSANWVFGLEGQGDWANLKGSNASLASAAIFNFPAVNQSKIDGIGLITGQVGYAWNSVLWYVKGGAAVARDNYTGILALTGAAFDRGSETRWGGAIGTGVEFGFAPNWSIGVEYDHLFLGRRDVTLTSLLPPVGGPSRIDSIKQDVDMATVRLNYRFGGPVVARH